MDEAIKLAKVRGDKEFSQKELEDACGVGVTVSREQISNIVTRFLDSVCDTITKASKPGPFLGKLRAVKDLKWADGKEIKDEFDAQFKAAIANASNAKPVEKKVEDEKVDELEVEEKEEIVFVARHLESAINSAELLEEHEKITGGKVRTRFPPEPNGFLHIGHAKAMNLSFGYSNSKDGETYLRYDDTNPEKEEQIYFDAIKEMVNWLGFEPTYITFTSDYFDRMHECAITLIKKGLAYMDFCSKEEIKKQRDDKINSPYRDTSVEENLKLFENMRKGKYDEGKAVLRVKIDMQHDNPNMRDFIAYRIKYSPHPHVGDKWCIYPSYDFSHCLVDSFEHITYSLCSLEFENRRDSYYWLLQALDLYRPHVYEFSRLNVTTALLSKRKILEMKKKGIIRAWDDARVMTLAGLRRRGYTKEAIISFINDVGVTRNKNLIPVARLEQSCRADLDERVDRVFCVMNPLKVTLKNYDEDRVELLDAPNHPKHDRGTRKLPFSKILYIEKSDFRMKDEKDYFGLAPNKEVGLRFGYNITCDEVIEKNGEVVELICSVDTEKKRKPKAHIHWLAEPVKGVAPLTAEIRLYEPLFTVEQPDATGDDYEEFINPNSEKTIKNAFVDPVFNNPDNVKPFSKYQFERIGYFCVDTDSKEGALVFNRTVALKADKAFTNTRAKK